MKTSVWTKLYFVFAFCLVFLLAYFQVSNYENKYMKELKTIPVETLLDDRNHFLLRRDIFDKYIKGNKYTIEAEFRYIQYYDRRLFSKYWILNFVHNSSILINCKNFDVDGLENVRRGETVFVTGEIVEIDSVIELTDCSFEKV